MLVQLGFKGGLDKDLLCIYEWVQISLEDSEVLLGFIWFKIFINL